MTESEICAAWKKADPNLMLCNFKSEWLWQRLCAFAREIEREVRHSAGTEVFCVRLEAETGDDDRGESGWLMTAEDVVRTGDLSKART
jgi:hypothetical protein